MLSARPRFNSHRAFSGPRSQDAGSQAPGPRRQVPQAPMLENGRMRRYTRIRARSPQRSLGTTAPLAQWSVRRLLSARPRFKSHNVFSSPRRRAPSPKDQRMRECECAGICENVNQKPTASIMHSSSFSLVVNSMFAEYQTPVRSPRCPFKPQVPGHRVPGTKAQAQVPRPWPQPVPGTQQTTN